MSTLAEWENKLKAVEAEIQGVNDKLKANDLAHEVRNGQIKADFADKYAPLKEAKQQVLETAPDPATATQERAAIDGKMVKLDHEYNVNMISELKNYMAEDSKLKNQKKGLESQQQEIQDHPPSVAKAEVAVAVYNITAAAVNYALKDDVLKPIEGDVGQAVDQVREYWKTAATLLEAKASVMTKDVKDSIGEKINDGIDASKLLTKEQKDQAKEHLQPVFGDTIKIDSPQQPQPEKKPTIGLDR